MYGAGDSLHASSLVFSQWASKWPAGAPLAILKHTVGLPSFGSLIGYGRAAPRTKKRRTA